MYVCDILRHDYQTKLYKTNNDSVVAAIRRADYVSKGGGCRLCRQKTLTAYLMYLMRLVHLIYLMISDILDTPNAPDVLNALDTFNVLNAPDAPNIVNIS